jgi:hypothetical protein
MRKKESRIARIAYPCVLLTQVMCVAAEPLFKEVDKPFAVGPVTPQKGWVDAAGISAGSWKPIEQPDLSTRLDGAKHLKLVDVAPAPRRISQGRLPYFCPNPDGKSWDIIHPYHKKYLSEGQVFVHDFGSGESKLFRYGTNEGKNIATSCRTDFHMKASYYLDKKMIFVLPTTTIGPVFLVYDPAVNDFASRTTPFDGPFDVYALDIGEDDRLYGLGQPGSRDGFQAFIFDPETYETRIYARKGTGQKDPFPYYRKGVMHGDWLYFKFGHAPWRLAAFNFKSEEFRLLATTEEIKGDHATIRIERHCGGASANVKQGVSIGGVSSIDEDLFECWLVDGRVIPRTDDVAPWSNQPAQRWPRLKHRFREFQRWPKDFSYDVTPPEIDENGGAPVDTDGHVTLPYRLVDSPEWKTVEYRVTLYTGVVRQLIEINASTLFAVDEGYGQHLFYDLNGKRLKRYLVQRVSPYAVGVVDDRLYVSGYPHFATVEYDLENLATTIEPTFLGYLGEQSDTHVPLGGLAGGADGCVYIAGTTAGRRRIGGGMAWYDMDDRKVESKIMDAHRIFWLTSTSDGKYILLSSKSDKGSRIFCWDTGRKAFAYDIPSPTESHAGPLEEALPGLVIGHAVDGERGLLYGLEAVTGKVVWRKTVPAKPVTSFSQVRRHLYTFRRGPDGFIWASFENVLVRIDARDANVIPVGRIDPTRIAFAHQGVYASGGSNLRRIEGLSVDE